MDNSSNNEKSKDKKKSFVERFMYFASQTMRINRKSEQNNTKKKPKKTSRNALINLVSNTLTQLEPQTFTFCDYCNQKIVSDFTGQNIICHDACKLNYEQQFSVEPNADLKKSIELLSSMKSDILRSSNEIVYNTPSNFNPRLSISLNDLSICDNHFGVAMRNEREHSVDVTSRDNHLVDTETGSYIFSTVDLCTIKQYGISIKKTESVFQEIVRIEALDVSNNVGRDSCTSLNYLKLLPDDLRLMMEIFNNNDQGLFIESAGGLIMGKIRVVINLLRPVKMLLTARPPSTFDIYPDNVSYCGQSTIDRVYYNKEVIFWLPRGSTKSLYININCPTNEVISLLLVKFNIQNNPKKFALYQHTITSPTEVEVCKLKPHQCPLKIMMDWCREGPEYFQKNLESKRFVLQENDPGSIDWDEFSVPELKSFLMILDQEQEEKKKQITQKYDNIRTKIEKQMTDR